MIYYLDKYYGIMRYLNYLFLISIRYLQYVNSFFRIIKKYDKWNFWRKKLSNSDTTYKCNIILNIYFMAC